MSLVQVNAGEVELVVAVGVVARVDDVVAPCVAGSCVGGNLGSVGE